MSIRIIQQVSKSKPVKLDLLISTIETSRDRIRTLGNMLITMVGILVPACLAFLLFLADKGSANAIPIAFLVIAIFLFLVSSCLSITSSFLKKHMVTDEAKFIENLLTDLYKEARMIRFSFLFLILGMSIMIVAVIIFVLRQVR